MLTRSQKRKVAKLIMRLIIYILIVICFLACDSNSRVSKEDRLTLYNDVLDQIVTENYFQHCLDYERMDIVHKDFVRGRIDSLTYLLIRDSLEQIRKVRSPKCKLDYAEEFQVLIRGGHLDNDIKRSITENLNGSFANEFLKDVSVSVIADTLSQNASLVASDLAIGYLDIVPYEKKINKPFGDGVGVISFSKPFFNKNISKAILFYEFNCGPKCGAGEILFLERKLDKWKVVQYKRIWDS
jgi:hypothetical protein